MTEQFTLLNKTVNQSRKIHTWLSGFSRYLLCWDIKGCWKDLSADICRYLFKGRMCEVYTMKMPITVADLLNDRGYHLRVVVATAQDINRSRRRVLWKNGIR